MPAWACGEGVQVFGQERASPASAATNTEKLKPPGLANSHGETQPRKGVGASELNLPSYIQVP